jgi:DNA-binding NtrC family response regulator
MSMLGSVVTLSMVEPFSPAAAQALALDPADWLAGSSAAITQLRGQIRRIAPYFRTAMLTGEPGCGELAAARMLHQLSSRCREAFLEIGPAEAEALLGAEDSFSAVAGYGTLYVRQPERLSRTAQRTLLRLMRERGAQAPRIVAFAERGLRPLVGAGGFSPELADALGAIRIALPPLRERREDVPDLLTHMLRHTATRLGVIPPEVGGDLLEAAMRSVWAGNLPQLQKAVGGLMERAGGAVLHAADLEAVMGAIPSAVQRERRDVRMVSLETVVHDHIRAVLFACNGNKLRTAEVLGISRSTLYRMLDAHAPGELAPAEFALGAKRLSMAG